MMQLNYDRWATTPPDEKETFVGRDWLNRPIYADENNEYIEHEGDLILDEPSEIRAYLLQHAVIKNTMEIYEEAKKYG